MVCVCHNSIKRKKNAAQTQVICFKVVAGKNTCAHIRSFSLNIIKKEIIYHQEKNPL